jgi:GAF domain-containing protein
MENNQIPQVLTLSQAAEVDATTSINNQAYEEQSRAITRLIARIRESCHPETTFNTTVAELRQLLNTNRVGVFHFIQELDWQGEFVYEDVSDVSLSTIKVKIHDPCFHNQSAAYQQGKIKVSSDIYQDTSYSCYIDFLESFQVRACIIAPLLKGEQLWGLLCVHECLGS